MSCKVAGCDRQTIARGWCRKHYLHWWKYGDPTLRPPLREETRLKLSAAHKGNKYAVRHGHRPHGMKTPTYGSWLAMSARCYNPHNARHRHYGGAGVTVCDRWRQSFESFLADMGARPNGTTLGRFGDAGNYEPGNCAWMTRAEQETNKRNRPTKGGDSVDHAKNP